MSKVVACALALVALSLVACAPDRASSSPATTGAAAGDERPIARVYASKCGSCHVPVTPGSRSRDEIERAMSRHGKRLNLTAEQWTAMVDYLAPAMQARTGADQNVR